MKICLKDIVNNLIIKIIRFHLKIRYNYENAMSKSQKKSLFVKIKKFVVQLNSFTKFHIHNLNRKIDALRFSTPI
jgi:hypothetical protein